ncbi:MAG: tetratricopeptide repeat protein [Candidatus Heimdallarchaeota archaeon]|nr:tetratricopeptide repeat protein [Candidatus Heimdallarchaeota archaeon]
MRTRGIQTVIFRNNKNPDELLSMGVAFYQNGNYTRAIECYQRAVELKPDLFKAWSNMRTIYRRRGKHDQAIECYQKALELRLDYYPDAWSNLDIAYANLSNFNRAIEYFRKAVQLKPNDRTYRDNLARVQQMRGT